MGLLPIINSEKKQVGELTLEDSLLKKALNKAVLYQAVKSYCASKHHGTVKTKTRAEVHRTGKKIYRQKGTGNARHSSRKCAPFVGGGRVFGPHPRDYAIPLPKKVRRLAIREALRNQLIEGSFTVVKDLPFKGFKTKAAAQFFSKLDMDRGLILIEERSAGIEGSIRNLVGFKVLSTDQINVFDLMKYPRVLCTEKAFGILQQNYLA